MRERFISGFDYFVLPFMVGMIFVLLWCIIGIIKIMVQLERKDRIKLYKSLVNPVIMGKNVRDWFGDCLFHVKLWKRNKVLGYMHSSIAFGWFMLILIGHIETFLYIPERGGLFYYPIFFRYFMAVESTTLKGSLLFFLMDFFLLVVLSGIILAIIKRFRSKLMGMRRTTKLTLLDRVGLYSLWAIFPLRLIAEGFTAGVGGGSFLTVPVNWLFASILSKPENFTIAWWAYSIALGTFMMVLPFTRYMHIPAEFILIPLKNAGIRVRRPRKGYALAELYSCPSCGVCLDACPMSVDKAGLKNTTVYYIRQVKRRNEPRALAIADKCLMCGKCSVLCPINISAIDLRLSLRKKQSYNIENDFSYLDKVPNGALTSAISVGGEKVLYYSGCMSSLTPVISQSVQKVLTRAGIDFTLMDSQGTVCCGRPLLLSGRTEEAKALIEKNKQIIKESSAPILLVSCAICYRSFEEDYDLEGIQVMHYTEYFEQLADKGVIKLKKQEHKYVYHDPCELGRGCGIYEAPRKALARVTNLVPAAKERKESICCGGSLGSLTLTHEERGRITENSIRNLTANSPDAIVTACPLCMKTFSRQSDIKVVDFAQVIAENMIEEEEE
jgi:Fe-S oxidoreductase